MKLRFFLTLLILRGICTLATAQTYFQPLWGKPSAEDLAMTIYKPDTSAAAVVLLDNGLMSTQFVGTERRCVLTSFRRVKLLKKSAFDDYGKHAITIRSFETLVNVKAQTINPDGTKTPVKEFFDEKVNKYVKRKKFAFPKLEEGSIIEYEYTMESSNMFDLYPWYFQESVPVRHSELVLNFSSDLEYIFLYRGQRDLVQDSINFNTGIKNFDRRLPRYWVDSVEAMKPESYVTTLNNYICHLKFQLAAVHPIMGGPSQKILQDWKALSKELWDNDRIGKQIANRRNYNDLWKAIKPQMEAATSDEQKIRIAYEYISKNVEWDEDNFDIFAEEPSLDDAFKKKKANSGELNMMLIACLNEAGIKALPMLVSTIDHGFPYKDYPMSRQFNHILCFVDDVKKPLFLDAGNIYRPVGVPRVPSLNYWGWVMDKTNPRWVDIPTPLSSETMLANMTLQEDGTLKGFISTSYQGYAAVDERTILKDDEKNEKLKKAWAKSFPDVQLDSIIVMNKDSLNAPFKRNMVCSMPNAAIVADDLMYVKPTLKTDFDENPFKQEKRNYPVELPYPIRDQFVLNMTIPSDYDIEELPKEVSLGLPNGGGKFIYSCKKMNDNLQVMVRIDIKQLRYEANEYGNIKEFFNQIVTKKNEQIVLKRKKKP
ncbi:MAG: DUF3857 and transglutaminase domain-containing protein [Saprospiraceae bacterium]|nr:DUF3857 and transglutaminase domain-containing protein [Saprospiraceae bacterium]